MKRIVSRNKTAIAVFAVAAVVIITAGYLLLKYYNILPQKVYTAEDFNIETVKSPVDFDSDGIDDYADIMLGARADAENHPAYDGTYYEGGYPPDNIGVCTDVVWRAFKNAGYSLKDMVDKDIEKSPEDYTQIETPDGNIDFRRVRNLRVFFDKYAVKLTLDKNAVEQWQPGDIVIFNGNEHIGIVSDKRNGRGQPYIIHNGGQPNREEDFLKHAQVEAHYRFDASLCDGKVLAAWEKE